MWEGRQLLGTIFLRWRRKHVLDACGCDICLLCDRKVPQTDSFFCFSMFPTELTFISMVDVG